MTVRVARAIQVAVMLTHDEANDAARAAILAMREPTAAMIKAGSGETTPAGCWLAMLDAALP